MAKSDSVKYLKVPWTGQKGILVISTFAAVEGRHDRPGPIPGSVPVDFPFPDFNKITLLA